MIGATPVAELRYATEQEFLGRYTSDLAQGAVFLPNVVEHAAGDLVRIRFFFDFGGTSLELPGRVIVTIASTMAFVGAVPGCSVQFDAGGDPLRVLFEGATGLSLPPLDAMNPHPTRSAARFPAHAEAIIEIADLSFVGETVDISYNGMLVVLSGVNLSVHARLNATLVHPSGERLSLQAKVMNCARCDHGKVAIGVQFLFSMDRVDEVVAFVDSLRGFHHARELGAIGGSLSETPLEAVLETFSTIANSGTIRIERGTAEGRIAYCDGQIVLATTGLVSGTKALGRMFSWVDARFAFERGIGDIGGESSAIPLDSAIVAAAIQRDELAFLDVSVLSAETVLEIDEERCLIAKADLAGLRAELVENARMGFPLGAILDILPADDAEIYKALSGLVSDGVLAVA